MRASSLTTTMPITATRGGVRNTLWLDNLKKVLTIIGLLATVIFIIIGWRKGLFTSEEVMNDFLQKCGIFAPLLFVIIQIAQVIVPIVPGAVGCVFGVVFWGPFVGFLLNYISICTGSIIVFFLARKYGTPFVKKMTGDKFYEKYSKYLGSKYGFQWVFAFLIFIPVAPDDLLCYLAGISTISPKRYIATILLCKPFSILLYSMGLYGAMQLFLFK